jgi:hypothetical protein
MARCWIGLTLRCRFRNWPVAVQGVYRDMSAAGTWRASPGAGSDSRPASGKGFDDGPVGKPVEAPGAREKAQDASWPATGPKRGPPREIVS